MGKIKTEGRVTLEFEPDLYDISITVHAEEKTSGNGHRQNDQRRYVWNLSYGI